MREARQRYYAALEHESVAQRLLEGQGSGSVHVGRHGGSGDQTDGWTSGYEVPSATDVYSELGMKVYQAVGNLIGSLSEWGQRSGGWDVNQARRVISEALEPLSRDLQAIQDRLERQETVLNEIAAGMRRIDRFTLDAFQRLRGRTGFFSSSGEAAPAPVRSEFGSGFSRSQNDVGLDGSAVSVGEYRQDRSSKRLPKEETVARALEAARQLSQQGRKLTLKSVAEAAGLKYSQIVYAFGSKDEMLDQVARHVMDVANAS